jgi:hypothetical protein
MSLKKVVGLLAGFALAVGLIGAGVGAVFTDSVTANENINVGTFSCGITTATTGATYGAIDALGYAHSVSYTAPTIMSSAAGTAPFFFTVKNTGSIADVLTVATSGVSSPWSIINAPFTAVPLAAGASTTYNTGVQWTELNNSNLGQTGTATWTVSCNENGPQVIFDNTPNVLPASLPSQPFQAQQTFEWGSQVVLAGTARHLTQAVVTMVTWAPQSQWPSVGTAAGYTHPITLNLYNVNGSNPNLPGTLVKSVTQAFAIPWRPAADPTCPNTGYGAGFAWRASDNTCNNGFAFNITFDLTAQNIVAPTNMIFGIAYNTQSWGAAPIGTDGPYDSLNVATFPGVATPAGVQASVGTFADPTKVFWNTATAADYSDGGVLGVNIFRVDTGWGGYEPAVKIVASY